MISEMTDLGLVENWSCEGVGVWLESKSLGEYAQIFNDHKIDGKALLSLTEDDLKGAPVNIKILGDIKAISRLINELRLQNDNSSVISTSSSSSYLASEECSQKKTINNRSRKSASPWSKKKVGKAKSPSPGRPSWERVDSFSPDEEDYNELNEENDTEQLSEFSRTAISVAYWWSSLLFTSFVMTLAHDRVPDMKTYPPLPDVILDNVPFIPWAFEMCEVCAVLLGLMWMITLVFHKHRLILIRRMCALSGTVFLLRAFTMYVTSMSVPGVHLECNSQVYGDFASRLKRALEIFFGMGMALSGVRSCGDYMFSGHTSVVTMLNFFITEYTPRRWYFLHTFCWLLNAFAIFFILAAHEHYTIDVVIAFYISSRLFLYYHTLACAPFFRKSDKNRAKIWFPMFWFFENNTTGRRIPNEFEWPFKIESLRSFLRKENNGSKSE